jgi:hypothetical protein
MLIGEKRAAESRTLCTTSSSVHHLGYNSRQPANSSTAIMSQFRAAKLDIGCFAKIRNIRDHTKRKVYSENEPERYAPLHPHIATED